jgi:hypothetical protein
MIVEPELPGKASRAQVGVMVKLSATPGASAAACAPGEHTAGGLELGYEKAAIEAIRAARALA